MYVYIPSFYNLICVCKFMFISHDELKKLFEVTNKN